MNDISIGQHFGALTVLAYAGVINSYRSYVFACACGRQITLPGSPVKNGRQRSCGCARLKNKEKARQSTDNRFQAKQRRAAAAASWRIIAPNKLARLNLLKSRAKMLNSDPSVRLNALASIFKLAFRSM